MAWAAMGPPMADEGKAPTPGPTEPSEPEELLKVLANKTNQGILHLVAVEPTYPRRVGDLLGLGETEAARRLKHMEGLGLVVGERTYIGKNVKIYRLVAENVSVRFTPEGLRLEISRADGGPRSIVVNPFVSTIPQPEPFAGREAELAALHGPDRVVVVEGMPGIGKTALLARFANDASAKQAVFWHSFRGVESLNWLANRMAVFLAHHGSRALLEAIERNAEVADRRQFMLASLDDPRLAFVLDDVHRAEDEAVRSWLTDAVKQGGRSKLVLASRERLRYDPSSPSVRLLHLGGLGDQAVLRLVEDRGLHMESALLPKVRQEVGGHPLALQLFLATAKERGSVEDLLDRIPERNLEDYLLQEVYAALGDAEKEVLAQASVFRDRFTLDDLRALVRKDPERALLALRRRLLVQAFDGEYGLHEVTRNFFYALVASKRDLHDKAANHYLAQGTVEGRLEAMHHLLAAGRKDRVLDMLEQDLDLRDFDVIDAGYQTLYLAVLEMFRREDVGSDRRWALIEDERGDIRLHRGELVKALQHYDAAKALFGHTKDGERLADLGWKRGLALQRLGRAKEARAAVQEGLAHAPAKGRTRERLDALRAGLA
jgi:tetratricopeptide (TPR) repeat protein